MSPGIHFVKILPCSLCSSARLCAYLNGAQRQLLLCLLVQLPGNQIPNQRNQTNFLYPGRKELGWLARLGLMWMKSKNRRNLFSQLHEDKALVIFVPSQLFTHFALFMYLYLWLAESRHFSLITDGVTANRKNWSIC